MAGTVLGFIALLLMWESLPWRLECLFWLMMRLSMWELLSLRTELRIWVKVSGMVQIPRDLCTEGLVIDGCGESNWVTGALTLSVNGSR